MNPSAHQSSQAPAQRSRRQTAQRDVTLRVPTHTPGPSTVGSSVKRRGDARRHKIRHVCAVRPHITYYLPTLPMHGIGRGKKKDTLPILFTSSALRHPLTLHTTYYVHVLRARVPLVFPASVTYFFLVCGRLPPSSDAAKCKSVTGEYASFTRSTTRCHGSAHAFCPPGLTDLFSRYELLCNCLSSDVDFRSMMGSIPRDLSLVFCSFVSCLSNGSGLRLNKDFVLPSYRSAF
ncbi:hypothetical protein F4776DRAFT_100616 [Hypoxylon sp. NC0597]|nr:hypothetical protein F4776DRAFT_100616 [Hypoxylon sp. NC0597]